MADTTLTAVPVSTYAGDSLDLLISLGDYPASDGWVLTYNFRKGGDTPEAGGSEIEFASTASGTSHLFNILAATTAAWLPGDYKGVARVALGAKIRTVWKGPMSVLPDLAQQNDNYDTRSHAKKCLDALNDMVLGKVSRDVINTTIAGQSIGRMTPDQVVTWIAFFEDKVASEVAAENAANGLGNSRNVLIRFGNA